MNLKKQFNILFILISVITFSQPDINSDINDSLLNVPTISKAIEMAMEYSPLLKSADIETTIKEFELKATRKEWMDNLGIESFYKYGSIDNVNIQNNGDVDNLTTAQTTDSRYSLGVYIKMPFFAFITQRNRTKIALQEIEKSKLQQDFIKNEIRAAIIRQYGDYEYNKKLITVKNKAYLSTQIQVEKANFDYENGNLTIYDLTKVMEASTKAETEYLKAQIDFKIAYLLLLEIIGVNNFNTKQWNFIIKI